MKPVYFFICALYFFYVLTVQQTDVYGQNSSTGFDISQPYCFRFTWLGPEYDESTTIANTSCSEYLDERRAEGVPCRQPMLITNDGSPPNITFLFNNETLRDRVICRKARGQVCGKYSYTFDGALQNVTYMCVRAYAVDEGAVTSGCYVQREGAYEVEVCFCESYAGQKPCNGSALVQMSVYLLGLILMLCFLNF